MAGERTDRPEVVVAANKGQFALLLDEAARVLGFVHQSRRARLLKLADHCHMSDVTLVRAVERDGPPDWTTLQRLAEWTEIPITDWLLSLRLITEDDLHRSCGRGARPPLAGVVEHAVRGLVARLPRDVQVEYLDYWSCTPGLERAERLSADLRADAVGEELARQGIPMASARELLDCVEQMVHLAAQVRRAAAQALDVPPSPPGPGGRDARLESAQEGR